MRRAMLFFLVVLLSSCSTVSYLGKNAPSWITDPPEMALSTVFVGSGEGTTEEAARAGAVMDVINRLGEEVDLDSKDRYFTKLYTTKRIDEFSTVISDEYSMKDDDGLWHCYVLTASNTARLNEARSREYSLMLERESRIGTKVNEALEYYKDNEDVEAVNSLLEAVEISLEGKISNPEYTSEVLVSRVEKYLSAIRFESAGNGRKTDGLPGYRIYRDKGIMHPSVENAAVRVIYPSLDPEGNVLYLSYTARSDENGIIKVNRTNAYSLKKGTMTVTVDIDEDIMTRIDRKAGTDLLSSVRTLINDMSYSITYGEKEAYSRGETVIAMALSGYDGSRVDISFAKNILQNMTESLGLESVTLVEAEGEDEEEALEFLNENYSGTGVIYLIRIGIVDRVENLGVWYTKTEGKVIRIDSRNGSMEEYLGMQYATANEGESPDDDNALENQIRITCGLVLGEF